MMDSSNSTCKLCCQKESKYVCPRCNIPYCSLTCYQSTAHVQCSESFYRDCVVEQIQSEESDPRSQKNMMEILQRVQQTDTQLEDEEVIDSDDDSEGPDLADRLAGVDLDDADQVWEQLSAEERRQFEELLKSGDVSEVVPSWEPWWLHKEAKTFVKDLESSSQSEADSKINLACPPVKENIQPLSKLIKVTPSPCVRWSVVNLLAAYAVTTRVYNGDHHSAALEATTTLISLCASLEANQLFEGPELAVAAVHLATADGKCLVEGVDEHQLKDDVQKLVEGPSESRQNYYILAALSDVHTLFTSSKTKSKDGSSTKDGGVFSQRFPNPSILNYSKITTTDIKKYLKKVEFYLSWANESF